MFDVERGADGQKFKDDETLGSEAVLLGRITYDGFAKAWPTMEGDVADKLNAMPKYVISRTVADPAWNNTIVLRGDVIEEATALKQRVDGDIVVHGSAQLAQALFAAGVVDELRLMVFPLVLGSGKKLFDSGATKMRMPLRDVRTVGDGVAILTYASQR